jgi:galactofuranose transport system permease protein
VPPEINLVVKAVVVFAVCLAQSEAFRSMLFQRHSRAGAQS